jgi:RNA ligase (TIGR02306 family)
MIMNNLATIQTIKEVRKHPNADILDIVKVLGWEVITKHNEFKVDDLCVYIVIDTILPEVPEFEFLRNKHFRIKPIRLRKEYSNGICFPINILTSFGYDLRGPMMEGLDVTNIIGIKKYEKPVPAELAGVAVGHIPGFLIITDEDNLRSNPEAVPEMYGRPYYITRKEDGSSGTYFIRNGTFGVCSRRIHLKESETNGFWRMARKYDIENVLKTAFPDKDIAIQGEVIGPGIQHNRLGLQELEFRLFNLFDINNRSYLDYTKIVEFTNKYNIPMVPLISEGSAFGYSLEELVELAKAQNYPTGGPAEGIVIRPKESFYSNVLKKSWSGKVINVRYDID